MCRWRYRPRPAKEIFSSGFASRRAPCRCPQLFFGSFADQAFSDGVWSRAAEKVALTRFRQHVRLTTSSGTEAVRHQAGARTFRFQQDFSCPHTFCTGNHQRAIPRTPRVRAFYRRHQQFRFQVRELAKARGYFMGGAPGCTPLLPTSSQRKFSHAKDRRCLGHGFFTVLLKEREGRPSKKN